MNISDFSNITKDGNPAEIRFKEQLLRDIWFKDGLYCRPLEIKILSWFLQQIPGDYMEIGVNQGATALNICRNNPGKMIYGVDLIDSVTMCEAQQVEQPTKETVAQYCRDEPNFHLMLGNSWVVPIPKGVGMVFIDADHTYIGVKKDTENVLRQLKQGYIFWHDFHNNLHPDYLGVTTYLTELACERHIYYFKDTWLAFTKINKS